MNNTPYTHAWQHYADELSRLNLLIALQLRRMPQEDSALDPSLQAFKGLVLAEEEMFRLLQASASEEMVDDAPELEELARLDEAIRQRLMQSIRQNIFLPLPHLARAFQLTSFEIQTIFVAFALELDRKYEKLYAYLQDDVTCKYATVELAIRLLCHNEQHALAARRFFTKRGKLLSYFFRAEPDEDKQVSLLSRPLRLESRLTDFLLGVTPVHEELDYCLQTIAVQDFLPPLETGQAVQERLRRYLSVAAAADEEEASAANKPLLCHLWGNPGAGKTLQLKHLCRHTGRPLLLVDCGKLKSEEQPFSSIVRRILQEAVLQDGIVAWDNFHLLAEQDGAVHPDRQLELWELAAGHPGDVFFLSESSWKPIKRPLGKMYADIELPVPADTERRRLWEQWSGARFEGSDWGAIASKFRFTPGQIHTAIHTAQQLADWEEGPEARITGDLLHRACYAQIQHKLQQKASRIDPKYAWDDIILPPDQKEQLRNACNQLKYRHVVFGEWGFDRKLAYGKGISLLFAGPPGTGKTMSAQVIAKELQLEIYKIDLSQVISKYIGETEKNLHDIFREAQLSGSILFFDEADALFGKRSEVKDAHDKYANVETAYLLQKMEEYEGVTILATNFSQNLDEAFMRRLNYVIKFPFPDTEHREKIWRQSFPKEARLDSDVDFQFLAKTFEVAGGNIKNMVVSGAFLAAEAGTEIGMKQLIAAAKYELRKNGKILLREDLGEYADL
ncbi:AAA family ATPase [Paenibacillus sp. y28]|uniref:AAA family ATPase n=1 Tax=Paenibacillus sp. y28 TaxID=3129110 RepID=UPI0030180D85